MTSKAIKFFIVREDAAATADSAGPIKSNSSSIVPLIPLDLLPDWIEIPGVSRYMSLQQTVDMTNVGVFPAESEQLKLSFINLNGSSGTDDQPAISEENEEERTSVSATTSHSVFTNNTDSSHTSMEALAGNLGEPSELYAMQNGQSEHHGSNKNSHKPSPDRNPFKKRGRRLPCKFWCRKGSCAFKNCRFEHAMPQTLDGLASIGLSRYPEWWLKIRDAPKEEPQPVVAYIPAAKENNAPATPREEPRPKGFKRMHSPKDFRKTQPEWFRGSATSGLQLEKNGLGEVSESSTQMVNAKRGITGAKKEELLVDV